MVHFRTRFGQSDYDEIIRMVAGDNVSATPGGDAGGEATLPNRGQLLIDATCSPADISYPTDLKLLNAAREKLEGVIDGLVGARARGSAVSTTGS